MARRTGAEPQPSQLAMLVAAERRLDERLAEARREAARLVSDARARARALDIAPPPEAATVVEERVRREVDAAIEALRADARRRVERCDAAGGAERARWVDWVVSRLLSSLGEPPASGGRPGGTS